MAQADHYIEQLEAAFQRLALQPWLGRSRTEVRPELLSFLVGSHIIFFTVTLRYITVVRVLHQTMDYERHLM